MTLRIKLFSLISTKRFIFYKYFDNKLLPSLSKNNIFQFINMKSTFDKSNIFSKPPSILIYTKDNYEHFKQINNNILNIVSSDTYTTKYIDTSILKGTNWIDSSTTCLILSGIDELDQDCIDSINKFIIDNGKIIIQDSKCKELFKNNNVINDDKMSIVEMLQKIGLDISSDHEVKKLTTSYLISDDDKRIFDIVGLKFSKELGNNPKIFVNPISSNDDIKEVETTQNLFNIKILTVSKDVPEFNRHEYFNNLHTNNLGKLLLHSDVCTTTLDISHALLTAFPKNVFPIVVTTNYQISGVGRGGNNWISPKGCLMFSFNYDILSTSLLSKRLTFIQHILVVAIVDAIHSLVDINDLPLKIKWPNDIYWDRKYKLGGIIVKSSTSGDNFSCILGAGLNVNNNKPTVCLNQFLRELYGIELSIENILAEIMNKFEKYIKIFEENDYEVFLESYYKYWLHKNEEVFVKGVSSIDSDTDEDDKLNEYCIIKGINEYGYLKVLGKSSGVSFCVSDDGNTFDMMKGLIKTSVHV
uniref:BPL/LPL catalytic domain-containing protein n=1 Tax=Strongyloides stercoralis TaxID=6248 RepID=A0A0K0EE42_STRER